MSAPMKVARRGFLSLLAAAPMAVPVAVKDAAAKMGLSAVTGPGEMMGSIGGNSPVGNGYDEAGYITQSIKEFWSPQVAADRAEQARSRASRLDPDLAAMRSVSPAWAHRVQTARCLREIEQHQTSWMRKRANELGLGGLLP